MASTTLQDAAPFVNPKHVVGDNSAGPLQTSIFPNYAAVPNRFGNNKVFLTDNMYDGTDSNKAAAKGEYDGSGSPLTGGRRRRRKSSKRSKRSNAGAHSPHSRKKSSKKRSSSPKKRSSPHAASGECRYCDYGDEGEHKQSPSNLCKDCKVYARSRGLLRGGTGKRLQTMGPPGQAKITANGGSVGAGAPQIGSYQLQGQSAGKRRRHKTNKKRKGKKRKGTKRRGKSAKRGKKGRSRRVRRGGMGCSSKKHKHRNTSKGKKHKGTKRRGGCTHLLLRKDKAMGGGSGMQLEFAQGFGINEKADTMFGATASPIPIKAYNSCGLIKQRN